MEKSRKFRTYTTKRISLLVCVSLLAGLLLSGCGFFGKSVPNPNCGMYEAVSATAYGMEMDITDMFDDGVQIELKEKGKAKFYFSGEDYNLKWKVEDDGDFEAEGIGVELEGKLWNGELYLEDVMDSGIDIKFVCEDLVDQDADDQAGDADAGAGKSGKNGKNGKPGKGGKHLENPADATEADGETDGAADGGKNGKPGKKGKGRFGGDDGAEEGVIGADYVAANDFVGDWEGFIVIDEEDLSDEWTDRVTQVYARFLFDEKGNLQTYLRDMFPEDIYFRNLDAQLGEAGTVINWEGEFLDGTFSGRMETPDNGRIEMEADVVNGKGKKVGSFRLYLQHLDTDWPTGKTLNLNKMATVGYDVVIQNMGKLSGMSLEDRLSEWAKIMPNGSVNIRQLPDAELFTTSDYNRVW